MSQKPRPRTVRVRGAEVVVLEPGLTTETQGVTLKLTDDLGLPCDPMVYAKRTCTACFGRGVFRVRRPLSDEESTRMLGSSDATCTSFISEMRPCGCIRGAYERARRDVAVKP